MTTFKSALDVAKMIAPYLDGYSAQPISKDDDYRHVADLRSNDPSKPNLYVRYDPEYSKVKTATISHDSLRWFDASLNKHFQRDLAYNETRPSINVNPDRGGQAIAKDITRRLLPDAQIAHEKDLEYQSSVAIQQDKTQQMVNALSSLVTVKQNFHNKQAYYAYLEYGSLDINEYGTLSIKVTLSNPEVARSVVAALVAHLPHKK